MLRRAASAGPRYGWRGGAEAGACTESLGSETGDVGVGDDIIGQLLLAPAAGEGEAEAEEEEEEARRRAAAASPSPEKRRRRCRGLPLPPAMPRASAALSMRAERRGGRLILTEVRGSERGRREVFRAERDGGRLRLRFADDGNDGYGYGYGAEDVAEDVAAAASEDRGVAEAAAADDSAAGGGGVGAVQHQHTGGCNGGGELCQVAAVGAAGRGHLEVGAVVGI